MANADENFKSIEVSMLYFVFKIKQLIEFRIKDICDIFKFLIEAIFFQF